MTVLFLCAAFLLLYSFFGYPLVILSMAAARGRRKKACTYKELPSVMFVFACCWEGKRLEEKIKNCLALDYPRGKLDIVAVSDAGTLETLEVLKRAERDGILRVLYNPRRSGKSAALARALEQCDADVFVVTDADTLLEPGHLRELVMPFSDPSVGAATAVVHYSNVEESGISRSESLYWRFEFFTRKVESRLGRLTGLSGAFYAVRSELFKINDPRLDADFLAPLQVLEQGKKVLLLDRVSARDFSPATTTSLFARRVRTITLALWSLVRNARYLNPFRFPILSWQIWSHKILRWLLPVFMILIFASNAFLVTTSLFWQILFGGQVLFYLAGALGALASKRKLKIPLVSSIWYFILSAWTSIVAFFNLLRGRDYSVWTETARR